MRADVVAFRELDTLVRNLTDQLAGYRRRALSAESRARELEHALEQLQVALESARSDAATATEARDHALAAARESAAITRTTRDAIAALERRAASDVPGQGVSGAGATGPGETVRPITPIVAADASPRVGASGVAAENERLRARLAEARDRTAHLADRVRFLRQQLVHGADR